MDKEPNENKEMPEDPVDKTTGEEKIQDKAKEAVEEKKEKPVENKEQKEQSAKTDDKKQDIVKKTEAKPKEKTTEAKDKTKDSKEKPKKTTEDDDFKYIIRLSNTDIDGDKKVVFGLTSVKGIGHQMANLIIRTVGINKSTKVGNLTDAQIAKLQDAIDNINDIAPTWMLNHRKDYDTGQNIHLIGTEIELKLRDEINIMKKIRCYRGIRHERGLPVRGQRTRGNNRRGLSLGVSKKRS